MYNITWNLDVDVDLVAQKCVFFYQLCILILCTTTRIGAKCVYGTKGKCTIVNLSKYMYEKYFYLWLHTCINTQILI